ncbi:hypothetical protein AcV5_002250 [Taiwanofungus camphoratus]|nr:hypothetical protein AcV5_002250 [Antrodia cinnamomea]KAI0944131.1 hypothetical protein AcV7_002039 [Antrodia cinnamomea]
MSEIYGPGEPLPSIPDDLTVVQFMQDYQHPTRPTVKQAVPWFIEDDTGRNVKFDEVRSRTNGLANAFNSRWKIAEDDVVCIFSPNHIDYAIVIWAAHRLGAVVTSANPAYTADELVYQLNMTKTKLLIVHPWNYSVALSAALTAGIPLERIALFEALPDSKGTSHPTLHELVAEGLRIPPLFMERRLGPGEGRTKVALLSFSSGTTGLPKAVRISHYNLIANVIQMACYARTEQHLPREQQKYRIGDVGMAVLPFYHIYGQVVIMHWTIYYGMSLVVIPKFDFVGILKSIQRHRITFVLLVPPMIVALCKHAALLKKFDLSTVRLIASGAAPLSAELVHQLAEIFPNVSIGQGYGMTETCTAIALPQIEQRVCTPGSAGRLIPGVVARVVKQDGSLAGYNETGELIVKSPSNALGYLDNEEATKETFVNGWVHTGDEAYLNESAELFVVDRIKDLIKVKGFQVAPPELEGHLLNHPDVADVCVVGVPDEYSGEVPLAFVVPSINARERMSKNPTESDKIKSSLVKHVADKKVHFKHLAGGVEFTDTIPRNPSGKLLRRILRDHAREMRLTDSSPVKARL